MDRIKILTDVFKHHGVSNIIFSPGSRNAPLIIGFNSNSFFNTKTIIDERSAAFVALGMAQQSKQPVAICSTSGSATLNYSPAICEAYYQNIPLIVLTADRPPEWINKGEGQSIVQKDIYKNYIQASFQFPVEDTKEALMISEKISNEAINISKYSQRPVHINLPFREPLYNTAINNNIIGNKIEFIKTDSTLDDSISDTIVKKWNSCSKRMILCGLLEKDEELNKIISELNNNHNVVILSESISNLQDDYFISNIDRTIERISDFNNFIPDVLITIGGAIISKKIKALFREKQPKEHWHITEIKETALDVFSCLNNVVEDNPKNFFVSLMKQRDGNKLSTKFYNIWQDEFNMSNINHHKFLKTCLWSDLKAHEIINDKLKLNVNLQIGNSTSIRYNQLFKNKSNIIYNCNRGVSGIDGSTSTSIGAAYINSEMQTILITGDLSFVYDINALWNKDLPNNLKIIIVNNDGGGIFRIIPGPFSTPFGKENFESENSADIASLAKAHNIYYLKADNVEETKEKLDILFEYNNIAILELDTSNIDNAIILKKYFKYIVS
jgi:2-succinyl-5-enolpyruvyl-6-hydroxy-3-cyclohexene-1-carboxylate synthase